VARDLDLPKQAAELVLPGSWKNRRCIALKRFPFLKQRIIYSLFVICKEAGTLQRYNWPSHTLNISSYDPGEWRFSNSSKRSLKWVLLCSGNVYGAVPVGHSTEATA